MSQLDPMSPEVKIALIEKLKGELNIGFREAETFLNNNRFVYDKAKAEGEKAIKSKS